MTEGWLMQLKAKTGKVILTKVELLLNISKTWHDDLKTFDSKNKTQPTWRILMRYGQLTNKWVSHTRHESDSVMLKSDILPFTNVKQRFLLTFPPPLLESTSLFFTSLRKITYACLVSSSFRWVLQNIFNEPEEGVVQSHHV